MMNEHEQHLAAAAAAAISSPLNPQQPLVVFMYHTDTEKQSDIDPSLIQQEQNQSNEYFQTHFEQQQQQQQQQPIVSVKRPASSDFEIDTLHDKRFCPSVHRQPRYIYCSENDTTRIKRTYTIPSTCSCKKDQSECQLTKLEIEKSKYFSDDDMRSLKEDSKLLMTIRHCPLITNTFLIFSQIISFLTLLLGIFIFAFATHLYLMRPWYVAVALRPLDAYLVICTISFIAFIILITSLIGLGAQSFLKVHLFSWHAFLALFLAFIFLSNVKCSYLWSSHIMSQVRPQMNGTLITAQSQNNLKNLVIMETVQNKLDCCGVINYQDWCVSMPANEPTPIYELSSNLINQVFNSLFSFALRFLIQLKYIECSLVETDCIKKFHQKEYNKS